MVDAGNWKHRPDGPGRTMLILRIATPEDGNVPTMLIEKRREVLPTTRDSLTHKFSVNGYEGYLTIGLFENGQPGEIFMKIAKEGSTLSGLIQGFCRSFSIALQYGLSIEDAVARFKGMRFDPAGPTSNAQIPHASSILDYVARFLELEYGEDARGDAA